MDAITATYAGCVFVRRTSGSGPYFGHYRFTTEDLRGAAWVALPKSWPTEQLACDDADRAAHFAIDVGNYDGAATRAIEAAAVVMTLNCKAPDWPAAVHAQRVAAKERDVLEARLLGAKERHWPDIQVRGGGTAPLRCR